MREKPLIPMGVVLGFLASTQYDSLRETAEEAAAHWDSLGVPKSPSLPECLKTKCPAPAFNPTNRAERRRKSKENRRKW